MVKDVSENVVRLVAFGQFIKSFDVLSRVIEARGENQALVAESLSVTEFNSVLRWVEFSDSSVGLNL